MKTCRALIAVFYLLTPLAVFAQDFELDPDAFPLTLDGRTYENPWDGGHYRLIPSLVDIDADGDLDLLLTSSNSTNMQFYRNDGGGAEGDWTFVDDDFIDSGQYGAAPAFHDLDGDGDLDVLLGGSIRLLQFENIGSAEVPEFELASSFFDSLEFGESQVPTFGDLNGDGLDDLLIATSRSHIGVFLAEGGGQTFAFSDTLRDVDGVPIGETTNLALDLVDIDNDNDLDLFVGEGANVLLAYLNTGTAESPAFELEAELPLNTSWSAEFPAPAFGDLDSDGDQDALVAGNFGNAALFSNLGTPAEPELELTVDAIPLAYLDLGYLSRPSLVDLDADGDLDLTVVGNFGDLHAYRNVGSSVEPEFEDLPGLFDGVGPTSDAMASWGDIDADGDPDFILSAYVDGESVLQLAENTGTAQNPALGESAPLLDASQSTIPGQAPQVVDLDGDGDADLFYSVPQEGSANRAIVTRSDVGSPESPSFDAAADTLRDKEGQAIAARSAYPEFVDWDGDLDLDLLLASSQFVVYYENTGSPTTPAFSLISDRFGDLYFSDGRAYVAAGDLNSDGGVDLMAGSFSGGVAFYRNTSVATRREVDEIPSSDVALAPVVFPNPARTNATVSLQLTAPSDLSVTLFDVLGREVMATTVANQPAGRSRVNLDITDLPAGLYPYRVDTGRMSGTGLLVVTH